MMNGVEILKELEKIVGQKYLVTEESLFSKYTHSLVGGDSAFPLAVIIPGEVDEISSIVKLCNRNSIQITIKGGGTGVAGNRNVSSKRIILSLERLNKIIEINKVDMISIVEAGVITQNFQDAVMKEGLCFPQNISSAGSSFVGGNVAVSSGSPKSFKYGTTKNYVLNLEVVLPNGEIIWTGNNVRKNAAGYNLTQLFVGSEGTLGIITKVVFQLTGLKNEALLMIPFQENEQLFECVNAFFNEFASASSIEFLDEEGYKIVSNFLNIPDLSYAKMEGFLWVEIEGVDKDEITKQLECLNKIIEKHTSNEIYYADSKSEIEILWKVRKSVGPAMMAYGSFRDLDVIVPRSKVGEFFKIVKKICREMQSDCTIFGHIGDGNLHVNVGLSKSFPIDEWKAVIDEVTARIFKITTEFGGSISGEHGIGEVHRTHFNELMPKENLKLMKEIKQIFDPNQILNSELLFELEE